LPINLTGLLVDVGRERRKIIVLLLLDVVLGWGRGCQERGSDVSSSQKIGHKAALCLAAKEQALESSGYHALSFVIAIKVNDAKALYD
jgi:hypothetical protein